MQINKPSDGKCGYIATFNGRQIEVYADSSYRAQLLALDYFKPSKNKKHLVSVSLAEIEGEQITQLPLN